jgi:hypothetical protein
MSTAIPRSAVATMAVVAVLLTAAPAAAQAYKQEDDLETLNGELEGARDRLEAARGRLADALAALAL